jgi:serine/threonine-protein kinase HipA
MKMINSKISTRISAPIRPFIPVFAEKMGIPAKVAADTMNRMMKAVPEAMDLIRKSFLSDESKEQYIQLLGDRHRSLKLK